MRNIVLLLVVSFCLSLGWVTSAGAKAGDEEKKLESSAQAIDTEASQPEGRKAVVERFTSQFGVEETRIEDLRAQKLGYGEISIAFSLAQKMPGGITDENMDKVLALRKGEEGKMGWGNVAKKLDLQLGQVVSGVEKTQKPARPEKAEKTTRPEKLEKPEKPDRFFKPEKPEKAHKF